VQHVNVMGNGMEGLKDKRAIVGVGETKYSRRWCLNRLDPSGERRAAFGEACEVAAAKPSISNEGSIWIPGSYMSNSSSKAPNKESVKKLGTAHPCRYAKRDVGGDVPR
jgi:hypothetical protein